MKLGLGTAQFGMNYGIANRSGQLAKAEASAVLAMAAASGADLIDTANLYGDSEQVLGVCLPPGHKFKIVTKTPHFRADIIRDTERTILRAAWHNSLEKLQAESLYALLVHNADDLLKPGGENLFAEMQCLQNEGMVTKIGVSVYCGRQLDALTAKYHLDMVQLPLNIFDQRLLQSGHLQRLKALGTEIHVRSAFLQGLLLLTPEDLPASLQRLQDHLREYRATLESWQLTTIQAPLWFLADIAEIDYVVCGVDNRQQFKELCLIAGAAHECYDFSRFAIDDESLVNPALWKK